MITKTCKQCKGDFECGTGTKKPAHSKFCSEKCAADYYKDVPSLPPPSGLGL